MTETPSSSPRIYVLSHKLVCTHNHLVKPTNMVDPKEISIDNSLVNQCSVISVTDWPKHTAEYGERDHLSIEITSVRGTLSSSPKNYELRTLNTTKYSQQPHKFNHFDRYVCPKMVSIVQFNCKS